MCVHQPSLGLHEVPLYDRKNDVSCEDVGYKVYYSWFILMFLKVVGLAFK
jgi:hypothetical protein